LPARGRPGRSLVGRGGRETRARRRVGAGIAADQADGGAGIRAGSDLAAPRVPGRGRARRPSRRVITPLRRSGEPCRWPGNRAV